jgi:signal transduction histidine kinase
MIAQSEDVQRQLARAEKLASIGRMAAGVAHEVGNPLSAIKTYIGLLERTNADPEIVEALSREAERIDRIVRSLLDYAHAHKECITEVDMAALVQSVIDLLKRQGVLKRADLAFECDPKLPKVRGNEHALEQLMVNLLINAVDAAPHITIAVGALAAGYQPHGDALRRRGDDRRQPVSTRPPTQRPWRPELPPGSPGVLVYVADSGPGVAGNDSENVFEPFYTTKEPGKGTGLGLALVQRTAHELGGIAWVDRAREGGAAFKVFLPSGT